ncbi:hypothetical protein BHE74_00036305 [Ensete ventricosum]|nr:hypothetical protein BHE74_00036305 [Ensete ventricosum]
MPRTYPVGQAAREVLRGLPQTKKYSPFGLPSMLQQKSRGHRTAMAQASRDENSTYSKESGVGRSKGCREMAATQSIWRKPGGRRSLAVRPLAPPVYPAGYLRRVGHVGEPAVRGCDDLAARSAIVISFPPPTPGKTFSRRLMRVSKMGSCA